MRKQFLLICPISIMFLNVRNVIVNLCDFIFGEFNFGEFQSLCAFFNLYYHFEFLQVLYNINV